MRNFFVPQSTQTERVAARPFFMVTRRWDCFSNRLVMNRQPEVSAQQGAARLNTSSGEAVCSVERRAGAERVPNRSTANPRVTREAAWASSRIPPSTEASVGSN